MRQRELRRRARPPPTPPRRSRGSAPGPRASSVSAVASSSWKVGLAARGRLSSRGTLSAARATMSSSAPCAQPSATLAMASAISAGIGTRTIGASRHGASAIGSSVRSAGTTTGSTWKWWLPVPHRPDTVHVSSIDDLVGREDGDAQPGDAVDDRLDAVAVDPVGVLAAAGEAPPAAHAVPAVVGGDRAGRVEHAGRDDVGRVGEQLVEGGAGQRGQVAPRARSDHHGPAHRRVGPGELLVHAHGAGEVGADAAVAWRAAAGGTPAPRSARRAGRGAAGGRPRSRRRGRRWTAPGGGRRRGRPAAS